MGKQPKMKVCKNCNNPISEKAKVCPFCGAKNKKPVYKRWWFWLVAVLIVIGVASKMSTNSSLTDHQPSPSISSEIENDGTSGETEGAPSAEPSENVISSSKPDSTTNETTDLIDGIRPEFKEAMDSYEAFFDEYVSFMEKYAASDGSDLSLLADYTTYMSKYAEMMEDLEAWSGEDMNTAETAYYIEVQSRINQKLLEVAE